MRVIVFHNFYRSSRPSGENNAVLADVQAMREAGHDVMLADRSSDDALGRGGFAAVNTAASAVYSFAGRATARDLAREFRPDVAHLHNLTPLWSPSVLDGLEAEGVPRVQVLHNYRLSCLNGSHMLDGAACYRCLHRSVPVPGVIHRCYNGSVAGSTVMAASRAVNDRRILRADWFLAVSSTVRERAIMHGVRADRISLKPEYLVADRDPIFEPGGYFLFLGRLDHNKGCLLLMDAYERYRAGGGTAALRIAGSGPLEDEVRRRSTAMQGVEMLGQLTSDQARAAIARARAVVSPALWAEPFGLTVLEAWREGRPPIVTDLGGPAELVDDTTGWVVNARSDDLAAAMSAAQDDAEAAARGSAGLARLRSRYSPSAVLAAYDVAWRSTGALRAAAT